MLQNSKLLKTKRLPAGHTDLKTTMQYYCQVDANQRAKVAAAIDELLKQTDARMTPGAHFDKYLD